MQDKGIPIVDQVAEDPETRQAGIINKKIIVVNHQPGVSFSIVNKINCID